MLFFLCLLPFTDREWEIGDLGIYQPIGATSIVFTEQGHLFIPVRREQRIVHIDDQGRQLDDIGRKGNGPGEFQMLAGVDYVGNRLYVPDFGSSKVQVFDAEGTFLETLHSPHRGRLKKTQGGWIIQTQAPGTGKMVRHRLIATDDDFEQEEVLFEWERKFSWSPKEFTYNPAKGRDLLEMSRDGITAYFAQAGSFPIHIIDGATRSVVGTIEDDSPPVPFNLAWGEKRYESFKAAMLERTPTRKINADFPETFPKILFFRVDHDHNLWVYPGHGLADKKAEPTIFNAQGQETSSAWERGEISSIVTVHNDWAYVVTFDREEEISGLKKMKVEAVKPYFEDLRAKQEVPTKATP